MKINKLQLLLLLTYGDQRRKTYIAKGFKVTLHKTIRNDDF